MKRFFIIYFLFVSVLFFQGQDLKSPKQFFSVGVNVGFPGFAQATIKRTSGGSIPGRALDFLNFSFGIHTAYTVKTKTKDLLSFQFEIQRNVLFYTFHPPLSPQPKGANYDVFGESDGYIDCLSSVQYNWLRNFKERPKYDDYNYIKFSLGASSFHRISGEKPLKNKTENLVENGDGMITRIISVNNTIPMLGIEFGKRIVYLKKKKCLDMGMVYYYSLNSVFTKEYEFFEKGISISKCEITYKGSAVMLNLRYAFGFTGGLKAFDTISYRNKPPVYQLMSVNGRKVEVEHAVTLDKESVEVMIWDKNEMDSDRVTIYLNDKIVATDMMLLRIKQKITLHLVEGANYLVFYATDMGMRPPVTIAARIIKNSVPKNRSFTSNENENGAWKIIYKPHKKSKR